MESVIMESVTADASLPVVAWVGIDWAHQEHHIRLQAVGSTEIESAVVPQRPEALHAWVRQLRARFPQGVVAVALEQSRGALIYALMAYDFLRIYPLPGSMVAEYRKAFFSSGAKSDPQDAELVLELVRCHSDRLRAWAPGDALTRQIALLAEQRRGLVGDRNRLTNRLTALLREAFPQALDWAGELSRPAAAKFLAAWPSLAALQQAPVAEVRQFYRAHFRLPAAELQQRLQQIGQAQPLTTDPAVLHAAGLMVGLWAAQLQVLQQGLRQLEGALAQLFAQHPDQDLWQSLPGAGPALAPRLLSAFGADRQRYASAQEVQQFAGVAPVTESSGKTRHVHWRWACPKFVRQSFQEFAAQSITRSRWARAYYYQQLHRGAHHQAAVRALAFKWIRILYRCWQNHTPYDESTYLQALARRRSPLLADLPASEANM